MKLVISADHAGFPLKEEVRAYLTKNGHEIVDLGAYDGDHPDDYPDYAEKVGEAIIAGVSKRGILICGSGVGVCIASNKIPGIRDIPPMQNELVEAEQRSGPFAAKGLGESGTFGVSPAIANAIDDAVGVRITSLPITAEAVLRALRTRDGKPLKDE